MVKKYPVYESNKLPDVNAMKGSSNPTPTKPQKEKKP
jgi:hypothetical protein